LIARADNPVAYRRPFPIEELLETAQKVLNAYNRLIARRSVHGNHTFFDPDRFAWVREVEAEWRTIRAELNAVQGSGDPIPEFSDVSPDQVHLTKPGQWHSFFFLAYGVRLEENCRRCPETLRILGKIPGLQTAFFSILAPGMHIKPHNGPYGGLLRHHLALKVPEPRTECRIRVGGDFAHWEEGKSLVFDDTYQHEVWNETAGERVVLFIDFERPLPPFLTAINRFLIRMIAASPLVQDGIKHYEAWKERTARPEAQDEAAPAHPR
jgi:ornithine lipid ester-linked acyl 2-hydroxylase